MGSQWVRDLETIASALLAKTSEVDSASGTCSFCGAETSENSTIHKAKCPVSLAQRVVDEVEFVHRARPMM